MNVGVVCCAAWIVQYFKRFYVAFLILLFNVRLSLLGVTCNGLFLLETTVVRGNG